MKGILEICDKAGLDKREIDLIVHGTTVATNISIEKNGAEVGMLTTKGFRDILHIGRHKRPHNFSLHFDAPWQSSPWSNAATVFPSMNAYCPPTAQ